MSKVSLGLKSFAEAGPYTVDLLASVPVELDTNELPQIPYKRIELKLHKSDTALPSGAPSQLSNNSIYFEGTVGGVSFSYTSDDTTDLVITGPDGVKPDINKDVLVVVRFADLFKYIDLGSITSTTNISSSNRVAASNPCPQIDSSASDLYTCIREGLEKVSEFGTDGNEDGDLDDADDDSAEDIE